MGDKISRSVPSGRCMYTSFLDFLVTNFPIVILPCPWPPSQTVIHSPCINADPYIPLVVFPSRQNEQSDALLKILPNGRISVYHCPSRISQKRARGLQLYILGECLYTVQQAWVFFLPQLTVHKGQPMRLYVWAEIESSTLRCDFCCLQNSKRVTRHSAFFLAVGEAGAAAYPSLWKECLNMVQIMESLEISLRCEDLDFL